MLAAPLLFLACETVDGPTRVSDLRQRLQYARYIVLLANHTLEYERQRLAVEIRERVGEALAAIFDEQQTVARHAKQWTGLAADAAHLEAEAAFPLTEALTDRELSVLRLLALGYSTATMCEELNLANITVRKHLHMVMQKLGVSNRVQAVVAGMRLGLVG
jgi:DNA-binding NarL/FixJ family response regulator